MPGEATNIAVFGDLHGRVLLPFYLCGRWQEVHGEPLACALCVGDAGIYRSFHNMEKTSRRWARRHPEELGFSKFFFRLDPRAACLTRHPAADQVLAMTRADLLFVPGNHEEHRYLEQLWSDYARSLDEPVAVDRAWEGLAAGRYQPGQFAGYERIYCLPQGRAVELPLGERGALRVLAINGLDKHTPAEAWRPRLREPVQVLLSHETYLGRLDAEAPSRRAQRGGWGSERLRELLLRVGPRYHFFGHHHHGYPEVELPNLQGGVTHSVGLNQVYFRDHGATISQGCFGVLRVEGERYGFEVVEEGWFRGLRYGECRAWM
jgi:hypothetical protein